MSNLINDSPISRKPVLLLSSKQESIPSQLLKEEKQCQLVYTVKSLAVIHEPWDRIIELHLHQGWSKGPKEQKRNKTHHMLTT